MMLIEIIMALALVESGNRDIPGDNGKAQGILQIHTITVDEANRIIGMKGLPKCFPPSDRHDSKAARLMCKIVLEYWGKRWAKRGHTMSPADYAAMWRFGPSAWKPSKTLSTKIDRRRAEQMREFMKKK